MVGGAVATVISLLALAWAKEIINGFATVVRVGSPNGIKLATLVWAVLMIYVLEYVFRI